MEKFGFVVVANFVSVCSVRFFFKSITIACNELTLKQQGDRAINTIALKNQVDELVDRYNRLAKLFEMPPLDETNGSRNGKVVKIFYVFVHLIKYIKYKITFGMNYYLTNLTAIQIRHKGGRYRGVHRASDR